MLQFAILRNVQASCIFMKSSIARRCATVCSHGIAVHETAPTSTAMLYKHDIFLWHNALALCISARCEREDVALEDNVSSRVDVRSWLHGLRMLPRAAAHT